MSMRHCVARPRVVLEGPGTRPSRDPTTRGGGRGRATYSVKLCKTLYPPNFSSPLFPFKPFKHLSISAFLPLSFCTGASEQIAQFGNRIVFYLLNLYSRSMDIKVPFPLQKPSNPSYFMHRDTHSFLHLYLFIEFALHHITKPIICQ